MTWANMYGFNFLTEGFYLFAFSFSLF